MTVMQTRADGTPPPQRPTKAKRKGKAGAPRRKPARRKTVTPANKADVPETK